MRDERSTGVRWAWPAIRAAAARTSSTVGVTFRARPDRDRRAGREVALRALADHLALRQRRRDRPQQGGVARRRDGLRTRRARLPDHVRDDRQPVALVAVGVVGAGHGHVRLARQQLAERREVRRGGDRAAERAVPAVAQVHRAAGADLLRVGAVGVHHRGRGVAVHAADERHRLALVGGAGLADVGAVPARRARRRGRRAVGGVLREARGERVREAGVDDLLARLLRHRDRLAVAVGDRLDRVGRAPHAVGQDRGGDVGHLERAHRAHAEGEREQTLEVLRLRLVVLRVAARAGRPGR